MRIHALNTGYIHVKHNYYDAKGSNRLMRLSSVLLDSRFMPIPVYTWVIEHPEGLIVVDTGLTAQMTRPDYFPAIQRPYWLTQYRFVVEPEDEIGAQMRKLGLPPEETRWLVLTHTHFDHTGALYYFPDVPVLMTQKEHDDIHRYRSAHFGFPAKWPASLREQIVHYSPEPIGTFQESYRLTQAGDVWLVPTPGHTMGHQSVILNHDGLTYFFAGDTSFDQASLLDGIMDAPSFNAHEVERTREQIIRFARQTALIYLTTHDPDTAKRLEQRTPLMGGMRQVAQPAF